MGPLILTGDRGFGQGHVLQRCRGLRWSRCDKALIGEIRDTPFCGVRRASDNRHGRLRLLSSGGLPHLVRQRSQSIRLSLERDFGDLKRPGSFSLACLLLQSSETSGVFCTAPAQNGRQGNPHGHEGRPLQAGLGAAWLTRVFTFLDMRQRTQNLLTDHPEQMASRQYDCLP